MNAGINVEIIHFLANPDYEIHFLVPPPRETLRHFVMSSAAGCRSGLQSYGYTAVVCRLTRPDLGPAKPARLLRCPGSQSEAVSVKTSYCNHWAPFQIYTVKMWDIVLEINIKAYKAHGHYCV